MKPLDIHCPTCIRPPTVRCVDELGFVRTRTHRARIVTARRQTVAKRRAASAERKSA